jgi:hypothetical protein
VQSDVGYLESSIREGLVPKGFRLRWSPQGLDRETNTKVRTVLMDTSLKIMEVVVEGMRRKEEFLVDRVAREINREDEGEKPEIRREVNRILSDAKKEADKIKSKKRQRDVEERERRNEEERREEEEDWVKNLQEDGLEEGEMETPESWEERYEEGENAFDFGRRIFQSEESIRSRVKELEGLEAEERGWRSMIKLRWMATAFTGVLDRSWE